MHRLAYGIALALVLAVGSAFPAAAQEQPAGKTIIVTGQGIIFNSDKALAKDKAIDDALRKAVEQVVGTLVKSATSVQNYQLLEDKIYTNSKGYVRSYKVLGEKVEENVFIVEIEAVVAEGNLTADLKAIETLLEQKSFPKTMILVAEGNIGQEGPVFSLSDIGIVENTLIDVMGRAGFSFVDHQVLAGKLTKKKSFEVSGKDGLSKEDVEEIANLTDAQIVITGAASAKDAGTVMNTQMHSGQANLSLRVINTDNGEILAAENQHAASAHIDVMTAGSNALKKAAEKAGEALIEKIATKWASSSASLLLEVEGVADYATLGQLKQALRTQIRGVKGVFERRMVEGVAVLDVQLSGKTEHFASELGAKDFEGFKVKIVSVTPNKVRVRVVK